MLRLGIGPNSASKIPGYVGACEHATLTRGENASRREVVMAIVTGSSAVYARLLVLLLTDASYIIRCFFISSASNARAPLPFLLARDAELPLPNLRLAGDRAFLSDFFQHSHRSRGRSQQRPAG